jgi:ankyrin repeat protein
MTTPDVDPSFEMQLRQWVEANPGRVNERDLNNTTPLRHATSYLKSVPLILWLVKEKGADVNAADESGDVPLHHAKSLDVLNALLDCGADPSILISHKLTPLMLYVIWRKPDMVARLLQEPRV